MRIKVKAEVILTVQHTDPPTDVTPEEIVLAAEQVLNVRPLHCVPAGARPMSAKAQYGIRIHMNEVTQVIK